VPLITALGLIPPSAAAQDRYRITVAENFRQEAGPDARLLARVNAGSVVKGGERRDGWVEVTLEGWVWQRSVRPSPTAGFDLAIGSAGGENLRDAPNGRVLARLLEGFLLDEISRREGWVQVRRTGWMWGQSLQPEASAAGPSTPPASTTAPDTNGDSFHEPGMLDRVVVGAGARLHTGPGGDTLATVERNPVRARILARVGGWARVQIHAWVPESDLSLSDDSVLVGVSAAEVRSDGRAFEGRLVRWSLQFVALQTADELRRDMAPGQQYLLTRGPLPEAGFVYVLVTAAQAGALRELTPLSFLTLVGRIRAARSRYLGNPILELVDFQVSQ
jgi:hypothetical protein